MKLDQFPKGSVKTSERARDFIRTARQEGHTWEETTRGLADVGYTKKGSKDPITMSTVRYLFRSDPQVEEAGLNRTRGSRKHALETSGQLSRTPMRRAEGAFERSPREGNKDPLVVVEMIRNTLKLKGNPEQILELIRQTVSDM